MIYISIDGDDIGRRIAARHLANDADGLTEFVRLVHRSVTKIESCLLDAGYEIIFSAADGVVARCEDTAAVELTDLYASIRTIGGKDLTFSAGVGRSLREAYVALLTAKSNGKNHLHTALDRV